MRWNKKVIALVLTAAMILNMGTPVWAEEHPDDRSRSGDKKLATPVEEQYSLATGRTYYFDLSQEGAGGTINPALPDRTLHYVPFVYTGTINAYSLAASSSGNTGSSEEASKTTWDHSLFLAEHNVSTDVSWDALNATDLIFGKPFDANYILRSLSGGGMKQNDSPITNDEWDSILAKKSDWIKNCPTEYSSWTQDTDCSKQDLRTIRGGNSDGTTISTNNSRWTCWRPALEVRTSIALSPVSLSLGGATLNGKRDNIYIVCAGDTFKAPSATGLTAPQGQNNQTFISWMDTNGNQSYAPGADVPNTVTGLTAQWGTGLACTVIEGNEAEVIGGADKALKLTGNGTYSISMGQGAGSTDQRIIVDAGIGKTVNITLTDVKISAGCAFEIKSGRVNLTLVGTNTLTSTGEYAGLQQNSGAGLLTIGGTGSLTANGKSLGIGGGQAVTGSIADNYDGVAANITINSGTIVANGIGGSDGKGAAPEAKAGGAAAITINGGDITSTRAAGFDIGGGKSTATPGDKESQHYGKADITITGGIVKCGSFPGGGVADAAKIICQIGGGYYYYWNKGNFDIPVLDYKDCSTTVTGGSVRGNCFNGPKRIEGDADGDLTITDSAGTRIKMTDNCYYLYDGTYTISGVTITQRIVVDAGKSNTTNITLTDVNISADCAFEIKSGKVNLTLAGTNTLTSTGSYAGLQQNKDAGLLTIDGKGRLTANGGTLGIGGGAVVKSDSGTADSVDPVGVDANITINSGVIVANGIGGSDSGTSISQVPGGAANITINGGDISSTRAAGFDIGGGKEADGSSIIVGRTPHYGAANITITGGTVTCGSYPTGGVADATNIKCQIGGGYFEKKGMSLTYVDSDIKVTGGTVMGNCFNGPKRITGDADGDLTIIDNSGARIQMRDNCYYLYDDTYTISGTTTAQRIVVDAGYGKTANITLHTADISSAECAFEIKSGVVNLTLTGINKLTSTGDYAALQQNDGTGLLTIGGTGSLTANGGTLGIGGGRAVPVKTGGITPITGTYNGTDANITINGGTIVANGIGGSDAKAGSSSTTKVGGAANIIINGGEVTSTRAAGFDIGGGKDAGAPVAGESQHYGTANITITFGKVICGNFPTGGVADVNNTNCQIGGGYYVESSSTYHNCTVNAIGADAAGYIFGSNNGDIKFNVADSSGQEVHAVNNVYTLRSSSYTLRGRITQERIFVDAGKDNVVNINLNGANISNSCAFEINSGTVNLNLVGTNTLTSTGNYAGLQQNQGAGLLTIGGSGNLTAKGGTLGIGGGQAVSAGSQSTYDGVDANITITGGTIVTNGMGGSDGKGEAKVGGAANLTIKGGDITSTGATGFDLGGGKSTATPGDN